MSYTDLKSIASAIPVDGGDSLNEQASKILQGLTGEIADFSISSGSKVGGEWFIFQDNSRVGYVNSATFSLSSSTDTWMTVNAYLHSKYFPFTNGIDVGRRSGDEWIFSTFHSGLVLLGFITNAFIKNDVDENFYAIGIGLNVDTGLYGVYILSNDIIGLDITDVNNIDKCNASMIRIATGKDTIYYKSDSEIIDLPWFSGSGSSLTGWQLSLQSLETCYWSAAGSVTLTGEEVPLIGFTQSGAGTYLVMEAAAGVVPREITDFNHYYFERVQTIVDVQPDGATVIKYQ